MQGKNLPLDDKFTDKAWSEMSKLLDREMPVASRRRKWPILWLLSLAGFGVAVAVCSSYLFAKKAPKLQVKPAAVVAEGQSIKSEAASNLIASSLPAQSSGKGSKPLTDQAVVGRTMKTTSNNSNLRKNESLQVSIGKYDKPIAQQQGQANLAPFKSIEVANTSSDHTSSEVIDFQKISTISPLKVLDIPAFGQLMTRVEESTKTTIGARKFPVALTAEIGTLVGPKSAFGSSATLFAMRRIGSNRLEISGGVGYKFIEQQLQAVQLASIGTPNSNADQADITNVFYSNGVSKSTDVLDQISGSARNRAGNALRLHYVAFPVQLNYHIGGRLNCIMGVEAGLLLSSNSRYTTGGIFSASTRSGFAENKVINGSEIGKVKQLEFATSAGVSYQASKRLTLGIQYIHGLTDVIPDNDTGDFNRFFKVGLQYKFRR